MLYFFDMNEDEESKILSIFYQWHPDFIKMFTPYRFLQKSLVGILLAKQRG